MPEPAAMPEPQKEPIKIPETSKTVSKGSTEDTIIKMIQAGLKNLWLVGAAGCGQTTMCKKIGAILDMPVTILSCNAGTSKADIEGYSFPQPRQSAVSAAAGQRGIIVLDEFTTLDDETACLLNAYLANGFLQTSTGLVTRPDDCIVIATSNTFGDGGTDLYSANKKLDAATINRFACGIVEVDYSPEYESQFDCEVVRHVNKIREIIKNNGLQRIMSTRDIINAEKIKKIGLDWKKQLVMAWNQDDKYLLRNI
jgi:MoxR-like ATPase